MEYENLSDELYSITLNNGFEEGKEFYQKNKLFINLSDKFSYEFDLGRTTPTTFLYAIIKEGLWEMVEFLVSDGYDITKDPDYQSIMIDQMMSNKFEYLLSLSPNFYLSKSDNNEYIISYMVLVFPLMITWYLPLMPKAYQFLNNQDDDGNTIFHNLFSQTDHRCSPNEIFEVFKFLVKSGGNPNIRNKENEHPISNFSIPWGQSFEEGYDELFVNLLLENCEIDFSLPNLVKAVPEDARIKIIEKVTKIRFIKNNLK